MNLFAHHLYEYSKGVRPMILHTFHNKYREKIEKKLQERGIDYILSDVSETKVNLFFGDSSCIKVVREFAHKPLNTLTAKEDFILGTLLGYDIPSQCERYLLRRDNQILRPFRKRSNLQLKLG